MTYLNLPTISPSKILCYASTLLLIAGCDPDLEDEPAQEPIAQAELSPALAAATTPESSSTIFRIHENESTIVVPIPSELQEGLVRVQHDGNTEYELAFHGDTEIKIDLASVLPTRTGDGKYAIQILDLSAKEESANEVFPSGRDADAMPNDERFAVTQEFAVDFNGSTVADPQLSEETQSRGPTTSAHVTTPSSNTPYTQVISEDLVVKGSNCVGIDCINAENFGADTLRLKENNLRIHFDDSSGSGSFPANDWRITINDSTNGGASYFAIDDASAGTRPFSVAAGSGNNAMVIDAQGDVGIGTSSPTLELQVTDGDTPALRLEQNGSNGWTPQTWDIAGNETNFFVRDVSNGSKLAFRIKPNSPESSIYIQPDGVHFANGIVIDGDAQGSWTPSITVSQSGSPTSVTVASAAGQYQKIGNQVTIHAKVTLSSESSTGDAQIDIGNLPFAPQSTGIDYGGSLGWMLGLESALGSRHVLIAIVSGQNTVRIGKNEGTALGNLDPDDDFSISFSMTYQTAE